VKIKLNVLKKCPLFYDIADDYLIRMLGCLGARVDEFDKKYTVFQEGAPAKYIGIVLSGSVQSVLIDYEGNRTIVSNTEASKVFAEDYACAEIASIPVSIVANEPSETVPEGDIIREWNCGFKRGEKLLRPARVVVSAGVPAKEETPAENSENNQNNAE
jgi:hypothetical protein